MKRLTQLGLILVLAAPLFPAERPAKNVILFLGDAAGIPTLHAASVHRYGQPGKLFVQRMAHIGLSETSSASNWVTDSAAGMTAIVTGKKTHNGVVSQSDAAVRGAKDGEALKTILEYAEEKGLSTGVVSNSSIASATPAACYAHVNDRKKIGEIFAQVLKPGFGDGVDVVIGPGRAEILEATSKLGLDLASELPKKGFRLADSLAAIPPDARRVVALFDTEEFDLGAATGRAIDILSRNPKGFFLMVESDLHTDKVVRGLERTAAFDGIIQRTVERMKGSDTLILFTADHSFDLRLARSAPKGEPLISAGPPVQASKALVQDGHHSAEEVLVSAEGLGAGRVRGFLANTDLFHIMMAAYGWENSDPPVVDVRPAVATGTVSDDPDDPAIWVHPADPAGSLILGTNKLAAPRGALAVFGLDGKIRQSIDGLDRPNNVDVEYGFRLGDKRVDIAVLTERLKKRLRVFRIDAASGLLEDVSAGGGIPVFEGQQGEQSAPMGVALYKRPADGAIFAIVSRKTGPRQGYLWQYRLEDGGAGKVKGMKVREFGGFSGRGEIEAIAVDDGLGHVYYADEGDGIHKWHADPDHPQAAAELAHFGREGFSADREGIAVYAREDGTGYILCTDQLEGNSRYRIYRREGKPGNPHDHSEVLKIVGGGADSTDGIDVTSAPLGGHFPYGLLVVMNSRGKNFLIYRWEDIAGTGEPKLKLGSLVR